jgi:hypothetical protein
MGIKHGMDEKETSLGSKLGKLRSRGPETRSSLCEGTEQATRPQGYSPVKEALMASAHKPARKGLLPLMGEKGGRQGQVS